MVVVPTMPDSLAARVERDGWASTAATVEDASIEAVLAETSAAPAGRGGLRDLSAISPAVRRLARHSAVREVAEAVLGSDCFVSRAILFDKSNAANWKVAWHQDLTIAVQERLDVPNYGPWSIKAGVVHVQPPAEVLGRMLAVRIHLDDCTADNGPLRVIPGSHHAGRLSADAMEDWKRRDAAIACLAPRGGILAFRPLLLHASSQAARPRHRRVVHFEFATGQLPDGLQWHTQI